jgi:hypothetical protein
MNNIQQSPCKSCYWQKQKEKFWGRYYRNGTGLHDYSKIAEIMEHRCKSCRKRWDYVQSIDGIIRTVPGEGSEIYNLNMKAISSRHEEYAE